MVASPLRVPGGRAPKLTAWSERSGGRAHELDQDVVSEGDFSRAILIAIIVAIPFSSGRSRGVILEGYCVGVVPIFIARGPPYSPSIIDLERLPPLPLSRKWLAFVCVSGFRRCRAVGGSQLKWRAKQWWRIPAVRGRIAAISGLRTAPTQQTHGVEGDENRCARVGENGGP